MLGSYDASFYSKTFDVELLTDGKPANIDVIDSAVKKTLESIPENPLKEKDVILILPQESFLFMRTDMPVDVMPTVLDSYLKEKARAAFPAVDVENLSANFTIQESENQKKITYFALQKEVADAYAQPFQLLDLKVVSIIPESLAYFKVFDKTLRKNKKETIWYVSYDNNRLIGYVYDSFGLMDIPKWEVPVGAEKVEKLLQKQAAAYGTKEIKLNRLILSGKQSEGIRQDTFTKDVGVWTNPLFRIIPHFYADYLKMLQNETKPLPILEYDMLLGAFIFSQENKEFSLLHSKSGGGNIVQKTTEIVEKKFSIRNIILFVLSFGLTFAVLFFLSRMNWGGLKIPAFSMPSMAFLNKATPTPIPSPTPSKPTPTPIPAVDRADVRIKILNGSGISGKASVVKDFFTEKGYSDILTGNADAFDYETTVVQIKKDKTDIKSLIQEDITSQVPSPKFETLEEAEAADVVVIVGTDFK
jgi:hypothetical protein